VQGEETDMTLGLAVDGAAPAASSADAEAVRAAVEFRVDVVPEPGGVRLCPVGEIDIATIGRLRESLDEAVAAGADRLVLDLRGTTFLDSTGLHFAVGAQAWALQNGAEFSIIPGPPAVQRTFDLARLTAELPFVEVPRAQR
jgi:anti-sigma B factor antagonist